MEIKEKNTGTTIVLTSGVKKFEKLVYQGKYYDTDKMDLEDLVIDEETLKEPIGIDLTGGKYLISKFSIHRFLIQILSILIFW